MQVRALVLALTATAMVQPASAQAEDCARLFIYAVNQVCRTLANGFSQCEPVGLVGPAPQCVPPGVPPLMPMPLNAPMARTLTPYPFLPPFPAQAAAPAPQPVPAPAKTAEKPAQPAPSPAAVPMPAVTAAAAPQPPVAAAVTPAESSVAAVPAPKPEEKTAAAPVTAPPSPVPPAASPVVVASAPKPEVKTAAVPAAMPLATAAPAPAAVPAVTAALAPSPAARPETPSSAPSASATAPRAITLEDGLAHFDFDRAELSARGLSELDAWLQQPLPAGTTLRVTGHADRLGPAAYNLKLSGRRAETVKQYLVNKGVAATDIQVVAKGESEPVKHCKGGASKATIACLAPNRRVEIQP